MSLSLCQEPRNILSGAVAENDEEFLHRVRNAAKSPTGFGQRFSMTAKLFVDAEKAAQINGYALGEIRGLFNGRCEGLLCGLALMAFAWFLWETSF